MRYSSHLIFALILGILVLHASGKSVISENGYTNLVVAISPDVPESQAN